MKRVRNQTKAASKKPKSTGRQLPDTSESDYGDAAPRVRFSATIHPTREADPNWVDKLDIDRIPDRKGLVRALVTTDDCVRLLDQGLEVHLHRAYPVQPLDSALIENDESFKRWLDKKVRAVKRPSKRKE